MNFRDWSKLESLFEQVLSIEGEERSRFLEALKEENPSLRVELDRLINAYASAPGFFESMMAHIHDKDTENALLKGAALVSGTLPEGTEINQYKVVRMLGQGGMGMVYLAEDTRLHRLAALKFLPPGDNQQQEIRTRFLQEARAASALDHPNICTIYEVNETAEGLPFIAMAYYEGRTLKQVIQNGIPPFEEACAYGMQLASGLKKAHDAGIIHRDIKPDNVIITDDNVLKILDFGLAKISGQDMTRAGVTMGTIAYMCPEQARGQAVNHQADLWSLGVVLFELFSGERPFSGEYDQAFIYNILNTDPDFTALERQNVPAYIIALLRECLEKEAGERIDDAGKVIATLQKVHQGGVALADEQPAFASVPQRKKAHIYPWVVGLSALVLVIAILMLWKNQGTVENTGSATTSRLVVLPMTLVGNDTPDDLANGLVYNVTSKLVMMERFNESFSVVPASDVINEEITTTASAYEKLNASLVISGSLQQSDNDIGLTLMLTDARTGKAMDSRVANVPGTDMALLQDRIIAMLADLLGVQLAPENEAFLTADHTTSSLAFTFYTQAQGHLHNFDVEVNVDAAMRLFELAVQEDTTFAMAFAGLAEAYSRQYASRGDSTLMGLAVQYGRRAISLNPSLATPRVILGRIFFQQGNYDAAELELLRALKDDPENADAHYQLARVYFEQGDSEEAKNYFDKAIAFKPDHWLYYLSRGNYFHTLGRHEEAIPDYQQAIRLHPSSPWGYNNLASQYQALGRIEEAIAMYQRAVEINTSSKDATALAYSNLGAIFYERGSFPEAIAMYRKVVALDADSYIGWDNLGSSLYWSGNEAEAILCWKKTLDLVNERLAVNPLHRESLLYQMEALAKLDEVAPALSAINNVLSLDQIDAESYIAIGRTYEILGMRQEALTYIQRGLDQGFSKDLLKGSRWLFSLFEELGEAEIREMTSS